MAARKTAAPPGAAVLEWVMGGLGLLIVLAALGVILVEAAGPRDPARLEARLESARPEGGGWLAEVEVANAGDETAAGVEVEGTLGDEAASATIDYVPAHGRERVMLSFDGDPRAGLELSVHGWSEP